MWEQVKMPNRHFLRSDIFTVAMVYSFYFRLFPNELNSKKTVIIEAACENSLSFPQFHQE